MTNNNKTFKLSKHNSAGVGIFMIVFSIIWIGMAIYISTIVDAMTDGFNPAYIMVGFGAFFTAVAVVLLIKSIQSANIYNLCAKQGKKGIATIIRINSTYHRSSNRSSGTCSYEITIEYKADDNNIYRSLLYVDREDLDYLQANMDVPALIYDKYAIVDFNAVADTKSAENEIRRNQKEGFIYCNSCGHRNTADAEYCSGCGSKLYSMNNVSAVNYAEQKENNEESSDTDDFFNNLKKDNYL